MDEDEGRGTSSLKDATAKEALTDARSSAPANSDLGTQVRAELKLAHGPNVTLSVEAHEESERILDRTFAFLREDWRRTHDLAKKTGPTGHPRIIGRSTALVSLFRMLERIRKSDATVLVLGENGTGKELVAKSIHEESRRANKAFVAANCSAFNDNLLESELFGHKRGAFTGAHADKHGLFEIAHGGTFFMDEVGDMSPALQVKLLRVLQEGTFMPVGGTETRKVDVRIVAATNRDLATMVKAGSFREDLYYRLNVVALRVPPLRERREDIPLLVDFFLKRVGTQYGNEKTISQGAIDRLMGHDWPGNVRELENEVERLYVLSGPDPIIDENWLGPNFGKKRFTKPAALQSSEIGLSGDSDAQTIENLPGAIDALEKRLIEKALRKHRGNKTKAAEDLGISRRNLIRKVQAFGMERVGREGGDFDLSGEDDALDSETRGLSDGEKS